MRVKETKSPRPKQKSGKPEGSPKPERKKRSGFWIYAALFAATIAVYVRAASFDFLNYDDPDYVANSHVRQGLTVDSVKWALTSGEAANWFPLTRISHLIDRQIFGNHSGGQHLTNVLIHALAVLMLFAFLNRATHALWPSAFVAFLFALHPLHVESVAWVAERKDALSALFWFIALWAYVRYVEKPGAGRYLLTLGVFCLGLMSKPMIVTLPFVLLLLDVWPLRRPRNLGLLREKVPFFVLSAVGAAVTFLVQRTAGAVESLAIHPLGLRIANALVSYVVYIAKMFWPSDLAVFYPYPKYIPVWEAVLAALLIMGITFAVLNVVRTRTYLSVGWLLFLGTLVPVIGLVQVGAQARADRYTYVPMIGLSIMVAWGAVDLVRRWPRARRAVSIAGVVICACLMVLTWRQLGFWKDSESLWRHAAAATTDNAIAEHNIGNVLIGKAATLPEAIAHLQAAVRMGEDSARVHTDLGTAYAKLPGRLMDAIGEYRTALRLKPDSAIVHNDLGNALVEVRGGVPLAIAEYRQALSLKSDYAEAHNNLGSALSKTGDTSDAIAEFEAAIRLNPDYADAHNNRGTLLAQIPARVQDAISEYHEALRLKPDYPDAHVNLGIALSGLPGRLQEAIAEYQEALKEQPNLVKARINLGSALLDEGRTADAMEQYQAALKTDPDSAEAHYDIGVALSTAGGHVPEAIAQFEAALRADPDYAEAHNNLGYVLSRIPGRLPDAIGHFEAALRIRPDYFDAHYNLGVALSQIPGRTQDAIAQLEAAQRLRPSPEVAHAIEMLKKGR